LTACSHIGIIYPSNPSSTDISIMTKKKVPADFPSKDLPISALTGAHPKLAVTKVGEFYLGAKELNERERSERYFICEDLAQQLCAYRLRKALENPTWTDDELTSKIEISLRAKAAGWGLSSAEVAWIIQHIGKQNMK
jgi:hypothetical protein